MCTHFELTRRTESEKRYFTPGGDYWGTQVLIDGIVAGVKLVH